MVASAVQASVILHKNFSQRCLCNDILSKISLTYTFCQYCLCKDLFDKDFLSKLFLKRSLVNIFVFSGEDVVKFLGRWESAWNKCRQTGVLDWNLIHMDPAHHIHKSSASLSRCSPDPLARWSIPRPPPPSPTSPSSGAEVSEEVAAFKLVLSMALPEASRQWLLQRLHNSKKSKANVSSSSKIFQGPQTPSNVLQGLEASSKNVADSKMPLLFEVKSALKELFAQQLSEVDLTKEGDQLELSELTQLSQKKTMKQEAAANVDKQKVRQANRQTHQQASQKRILPPGPQNSSQLGIKRLKSSQGGADQQSNKVLEIKKNLKGMNIDIKIQPSEPKPTGVSFSNISEIRNLLKQEQAPSQATSDQTSSSPNFAKRRIENMNRLTRPNGNQVAQPVITKIHNCLLCRFTSIPTFNIQTPLNFD